MSIVNEHVVKEVTVFLEPELVALYEAAAARAGDRTMNAVIRKVLWENATPASYGWR